MFSVASAYVVDTGSSGEKAYARVSSIKRATRGVLRENAADSEQIFSLIEAAHCQEAISAFLCEQYNIKVF